jgi:osmoprotectant transport system permease protein
MIDYMLRHHDRIARLLGEHLFIALTAEGIAFLIAFSAALLIRRYKFFSLPVNAFCNAVFAVPTLALFSVLIPLTGLGKATAVITLVLYNQFILIKGISGAFESVDPSVIQAAEAIGLSRMQIFTTVKIPLALPLILNGLKLSLAAAIAGATLGAVIGAGGLGVLIFNGLAMKNGKQVAWGVILSSLCAYAANRIMQGLENRALKKSRGDI